MSQTPDQIRAQVERTRADLAQDVDALSDKVSPSKAAGRTLDSAKSAAVGVKDKVMGAAHEATSTVGEAVHGGASTASSSAGSAVEGAKQAPQAIATKAGGSPVIAGAVAFGVGYLLSSLLPATRRETEMAGAVKEKATDLKEPITAALGQAAHEAKEALAPQAQQAVSSIKETAEGAVAGVQEKTAEAGQEVKEQTQEAASSLRDPYPPGDSQPTTRMQVPLGEL